MEKPPYIFKAITHFLVKNVEEVDSRIDCITKLTLEIGSQIPPGRHSLTLIKPFPPFGRKGTNLSMLESLRAEDIESIWAFRRTNSNKCARVEIRRKGDDPTVPVRCERIEGVPGRDKRQS